MLRFFQSDLTRLFISDHLPGLSALLLDSLLLNLYICYINILMGKGGYLILYKDVSGWELVPFERRRTPFFVNEMHTHSTPITA